MSSSAPILDTTRAGILASQDYRDFIADLKGRIHFGANSREPQGFQPKMSGGCANSTLCTRNPNFSHNS